MGDCDGSNSVSIDELVSLVNIAVERVAPALCLAGDGDRNGVVSVDELVVAKRPIGHEGTNPLSLSLELPFGRSWPPRAQPPLTLRPADANEVAEAWRYIMRSRNHPVALILTRQAIPTLDRTRYAPAAGLHQGGYVISDSDGPPELILIASGSEVSLCLAAQDALLRDGVRARVVSMASFEIYEAQPLEYRLQVLPAACRKRLAVELGSSLGWRRYVGIPPDGGVIALRHFGASAPWKDLQKHFGLTVEDVVKKAKQLMAGEVTDR